jgi:predicted nucleotide-binding protein
VLSLLTTALGEQDDPFLVRLKEKVDTIKLLTRAKIVRGFQPSGQVRSADELAITQGFQIPPHISVLSEVIALRQPPKACRELAHVARKAGSHLARKQRRMRRTPEIGTNIFIGHGRSLLWKELKDFVQDRLGFPWDEFNRVPVAGITNIARLSEMLDAAAIAFLVMTGEDEQVDGKLRARMNVVHEAGLFQGRLGFTRAIVLLEEGCEEFSNIQGLGQIRFPKGNIKAAFEEIRQVLEREGLL